MVRSVLPRLDYQASYFGKVVSFDQGRQQVDVVPDDARLPTMQGIPLRGPAGVHWTIDPSTAPSVAISWENGDPSRPFAFGFSTGAHVLSATWNADQLILGGAAGAEPPPKGVSLNNALDTFTSALSTYATAIQGIADPSGLATATLAAAIVALQASLPGTLATNVKVK